MAVKNSFPAKIKMIPKGIAVFFKNMGENGCFTIWMAGLFVAAALLWGLTSSMRSRNLAAQANVLLAAAEEKTRLKEPLRLWGLSGTSAQTGSWFVTEDNRLAVVWNLPVDGIFAPFLTVFDYDAQIEKTLPLSITAESFAVRTSNGIPQVWLDRICRSALLVQGGR